MALTARSGPHRSGRSGPHAMALTARHLDPVSRNDIFQTATKTESAKICFLPSISFRFRSTSALISSVKQKRVKIASDTPIQFDNFVEHKFHFLEVPNKTKVGEFADYAMASSASVCLWIWLLHPTMKDSSGAVAKKVVYPFPKLL